MEKILVTIYEDIFCAFAETIIEAESLEEFNSKLHIYMEETRVSAEVQGIELAGANYNLPKGWR